MWLIEVRCDRLHLAAEHVVTGVSNAGVGPRHPLDGVSARAIARVQPIVAVAAADHVILGSALDHVVIRGSEQQVAATAAPEGVPALVALDLVSEGSAPDGVVP